MYARRLPVSAFVAPAQAGAQSVAKETAADWIPACAGMTRSELAQRSNLVAPAQAEAQWVAGATSPSGTCTRVAKTTTRTPAPTAY